MDIAEYISPALITLLPVLYALGWGLKKSKLPDWTIPFVLGGTGIILAWIWLFAVCIPTSPSEFAKTLAYGAVQGSLCAAATVYAHNLVKQYHFRNK